MDRRAFLAAAASGLALMGHSPYRRWYQYRARHTVIAADRLDGRAFEVGERLADYLAARRPDLNARAVRAQDPRTVVSLLKSRQLDVGLLRAEDAYQALTGRGPFADLETPLRALAAVAPEYLHVVVPAAAAIRSIDELGTGRVGVVDGGRARVKAERVLSAFGLDAEGRWESLGADEVLPGLATGRVAACCFESPRPAAVPAAGPRPPDVRLRLIPHGEAVPRLVARYGPIYFRARLATTAPEVEGETDLLAELRLLVCREDYPADRARALAAALAGWEAAAPQAPLPIPRHPALAAEREAA